MSWRTRSKLVTLLAVAGALSSPAASPAMPAGPRLPTAASHPAVASPRPHRGDRVATILIPKLDLRIPVREGCGLGVLARGVCHYPGGALPGEPGTVALAGHRVTPVGGLPHGPFRYLNRLRPGDLIALTREGRRRAYVVTGTAVVRPARVGVLAGPDLVLTACHPPGLATYRLVVSARAAPGRSLRG